MPITFIITHQRPSTDVPWTEMTTEFQERVNHFLGTGQLTDFTIVNNDSLNTTSTIVFPDSDSKDIVINDSAWTDFRNFINADYEKKGIVNTEVQILK